MFEVLRKTAFLSFTSLFLTCFQSVYANQGLQSKSELDETLSQFLAGGEIPAMALAEFSCSETLVSAGGVRRTGESTQISTNALFNIGSNGKAILATAAMRLDAKGTLSVDEAIGWLWPEITADHPEKANITLAQLLSHTSGLPAFDTGSELEKVPVTPTDGLNETVVAAHWFLDQPLAAEPGTKVIYSNAGYVVAGAVLEHVTRQSIQEIIKSEIFDVLEIKGDFGEPRKLGIDGPYGHYLSNENVVAYDEDEPPLPGFLLAAGNIAISMPNYLSFLQANLCSLRKEPSVLLTTSMAERIHTPAVSGGSGLGWGITEFEERPVSFHIGGTGDFTAFVIFDPAVDFGLAAMMNIGGAPAAVVQQWMVERMKTFESSPSSNKTQ